VGIDELIRSVDIALRSGSADQCPGLDSNQDGAVTIDELVRAVGDALGPCA
jgi:hypothetical protein